MTHYSFGSSTNNVRVLYQNGYLSGTATLRLHESDTTATSPGTYDLYDNAAGYSIDGPFLSSGFYAFNPGGIDTDAFRANLTFTDLHITNTNDQTVVRLSGQMRQIKNQLISAALSGPPGYRVQMDTSVAAESGTPLFALEGLALDGSPDAYGTERATMEARIKDAQLGYVDVVSLGALQFQRPNAVPTAGHLLIRGATQEATLSYSNGVLSSSVAPLSSQGSLDDTFGQHGTATTDMGALPASFSTLAQQPDGKLVVGGAANVLTLERYSADGVPDATFGTAGKAVEPSLMSPWTLVAQADGKLVAATTTATGFRLVRFTADGVRDLSFGNSGAADITLTPAVNSYPFSCALTQSNGKLVIAGGGSINSSSVQTSNYWYVARLSADGQPDATFGSNGHASTMIPGIDAGLSTVASQPDGRIVLLGSSHDGTLSHYEIVRFNTDGMLDAGFGAGGRVDGDGLAGSSRAHGVVFQADGSLIVATSYRSHSQTDYSVDLVRLRSNGTLDTTFAQNGMARYAVSVAPTGGSFQTDSDGKLVLALTVNYGVWGRFGVMRFLATGELDNTFGSSGMMLAKPGDGMLSVNTMLLQGNRAVVAGSVNDTFVIARFSP